jgi:hypothetical protein
MLSFHRHQLLEDQHLPNDGCHFKVTIGEYALPVPLHHIIRPLDSPYCGLERGAQPYASRAFRGCVTGAGRLWGELDEFVDMGRSCAEG